MNINIVGRSYNDIVEPLNKEINTVNQLIKANFASDYDFLNLILSKNISVHSKQIRPYLLLACSGLLGKIDNSTIEAAAMVEELHQATLLHDDVVDNANLRHNQITINANYGNKIAVLAGDYVFTAVLHSLNKLQNFKLQQIICDTIQKMTQGEMMQIKCSLQQATIDDYNKIISFKTASLIEASFTIAAILHECSLKDFNSLKTIGYNIGMAFQLIDDLLDYEKNNAEYKKPLGIDLMENKLTMPILHLLNSADSNDKQVISSLLTDKNNAKDKFDKIYKYLQKYQSLSYTRNIALENISIAKNLLLNFPQNTYNTMLNDIFDFIGLRME